MGDLLLWSCSLPSSGECHSQLQARINCFRFPHNDPFLPSSSLLPLLILLLLFLLPASPLHFFLPLLSFILFPPFTSLLPFIHPFLSLSLPPSNQPVEEVGSHVDRGYRMDAPDGCPDVIYHIMQECWNKDRTQRPNFARIERMLDSI